MVITSPLLASISSRVQSITPLTPSTRVVDPCLIVSLSYFSSVETLYSKLRFVSAVIVSCKVLEAYDWPLLPLISTSSPSSVVTFHFLVLLGEPGSVSAVSGRPVKKSSNVLVAASADAGSMLASISSTSSRDRSFFFIIF